jgi:hypothetical protein
MPHFSIDRSLQKEDDIVSKYSRNLEQMKRRPNQPWLRTKDPEKGLEERKTKRVPFISTFRSRNDQGKGKEDKSIINSLRFGLWDRKQSLLLQVVLISLPKPVSVFVCMMSSS